MERLVIKLFYLIFDCWLKVEFASIVLPHKYDTFKLDLSSCIESMRVLSYLSPSSSQSIT